MEITLPENCREEYKARASVVFSIIDALEAGQPPADWIQQLDRAEIGSYGERWAFARFLGAKAVVVRWTPKQVRFDSKPHHWPEKYELIGPNPKLASWWCANPGFYEPTANIHRYCDDFIVDCLETAAKVALVKGQHKAVKACLQAYATEITTPTIKSVMMGPRSPTEEAFLDGLYARRQAMLASTTENSPLSP